MNINSRIIFSSKIVIIPSADFADDENLLKLIEASNLSIREVFEEDKYGAKWKTYILAIK